MKYILIKLFLILYFSCLSNAQDKDRIQFEYITRYLNDSFEKASIVKLRLTNYTVYEIVNVLKYDNIQDLISSILNIDKYDLLKIVENLSDSSNYSRFYIDTCNNYVKFADFAMSSIYTSILILENTDIKCYVLFSPSNRKLSFVHDQSGILVYIYNVFFNEFGWKKIEQYL